MNKAGLNIMHRCVSTPVSAAMQIVSNADLISATALNNSFMFTVILQHLYDLLRHDITLESCFNASCVLAVVSYLAVGTVMKSSTISSRFNKTEKCEFCAQRSSTPVTADSVAERTNDYTKSYASAVVQLGQELQLPVVDLWTEMQLEPDWQTNLLCDGLHLTSAGNTFVYEHLQPAIDNSFPLCRYADLQSHCEAHSS